MLLASWSIPSGKIAWSGLSENTVLLSATVYWSEISPLPNRKLLCKLSSLLLNWSSSGNLSGTWGPAGTYRSFRLVLPSYLLGVSHFFFFLITCLNFRTAKLSSIDVSVSVVCSSSARISEIILPLFCIRPCCSLFRKGFNDGYGRLRSKRTL